MTITRILALLSVIALLAALPLAALAQGGDEGPPVPPFQVVGKATIDGEPAMDGTMVVAMIDGEKAGTGTVMDGKFSCRRHGRNGRHDHVRVHDGRGRRGHDVHDHVRARRGHGRHARRAQDRQPHGPGRRDDG